MKGMGQIVAWSARDETLHTLSIINLFLTFVRENPEVMDDSLVEELNGICRSIVEHEDAFIDLAFGMGEIEGLTASAVKQYIRYIGDRRLLQLQLEPIFHVKKNPITKGIC